MMRARYGTGVFLDFLSENVKTIKAFGFFNFDELTSIKIPDSAVCIETSAFACCYNLTAIDIGNNVETIENQAFSHCYKLTLINLPDSVTYIGNEAFRSCVNLKKVTLGNNIKYIGDSAFYKCSYVIISAPIGSYAEEYAKNNNLKFISI